MPTSSSESSLTLHATCVRWRDHGVLLEGPPGSGKSDLALRLLDAGAVLVADDVVEIRREGAGLAATACRLPGHIEVRGQGIYVVAVAAATRLDLAVRLADRPAERLPLPETRRLLDVDVPSITLGPDRSSALARIGIALSGTRVT
jgi:serine kinase of HPr protein (carbohydrate metabolism regulator)